MVSSRKLLPEEYRHDAPIGTEIRFNHTECGDTKARLYVSRTPDGWKHHCHNCAPKMSGLTYDRTPSISKTMERLAYAQAKHDESMENSETCTLPLGYTTDLPVDALIWLYTYDLTDEEIEDYQIGWDADTRRVILPWFDTDGNLLLYQARTLDAVTKSNPKYIHEGARGNVFATLPNKDCRTKATIVEDLISAIKVARFTTSICLFGSHVDMSLYRHLGENYAAINIWLDHDKMPEAFKYAKRLRCTQDIPVNVIGTKYDPKACRDSVIKAQTCYSSEGCAKLLEAR